MKAFVASTLRNLDFVQFSKQRMIWLGLVMVVLAAHLGGALRDIRATAGYPQHSDQQHLVGQATRILRTGSLNPEFFKYPSVPIYLTTIGEIYGFMNAQKVEGRTKALRIEQLGSMHQPYIEHPEVVQGARVLFAILSTIAMGMIGWFARALYGNFMLWAAPLILAFSQGYYLYSWRYLNVDIIVAFGAAMSMCAMFCNRNSDRFLDRVFLPAICVGFSIGCKYTMGVLILPLLLCQWLFPGPRPLLRSLAACLIAMATFVVCVPFSILDMPLFVNDVGYEVWHYAIKGHKGFDAQPGVDQLVLFTKYFAHQFSWVGLFLAVVGVFTGLRRAPRRTVICLSFVIGLAMLFICQKVHFNRNVVCLLGFLAMWMALGMSTVFSAASNYWKRSSWFQKLNPRIRIILKFGFGFLLMTSLLFGYPTSNIKNRIIGASETRNDFIQWARTSLSGQVIHIPKELDIDVRSLKSDLRIRRFSLENRNEARDVANNNGEYVLKTLWRDNLENVQDGICGNTIQVFKGRSIDRYLTVNPELRILKIGPCS